MPTLGSKQASSDSNDISSTTADRLTSVPAISKAAKNTRNDCFQANESKEISKQETKQKRDREEPLGQLSVFNVYHELDHSNHSSTSSGYTAVDKSSESSQASSGTYLITQLNECYSTYLYVRSMKHGMLSQAQRKKLLEKWNADYTGYILHMNGEMCLRKHLAASHYLLEEFEYIQRHVPDFKFCDSLMETIFWTLEEYLYPRITDLFQNRADKLTPSQTAELVSFIHDFSGTAKAVLPDFNSHRWDAESMFRLYCKRIQKDTDDLIQALVAEYTKETNIRRTAEEFLVTDLAPQITFLLESQRCTMTESLPSEYHARLYDVCFQEISRLAGELLQVVKSYKYQSSSGLHQFCALINDCEAIAEIADDFFGDEASKNADSLATLWTQMTLTITTLLADKLMGILHEPGEFIFSSVGRPTWGKVGERVAATIEDYLTDLPVWLSNPDYYVPKILHECVDRSLQDYLKSLFSHTMEDGVDDPWDAANRVRADSNALVNFFAENYTVSSYHGVAGFYTSQAIRQKFEVLGHVANLIDPNVEPEAAMADVIIMHRTFDRNQSGSPTVLHLVGLRKRHESDESAEWLRIIARAKRGLETSESQEVGDDLSPTASNIQDSRFLHNVRTGYRVQRQLSISTKNYIASSRLLQREKAKGFRRLKNFASHRVPEQLWS